MNWKTARLHIPTPPSSQHGLELFRFKLKDALLDHRAFFDLDGQTIIVLGIFHRDEAYTPDSLDELEDRM